jgi:transposase
MCLRPSPVPPVPEETARVARLAFARGNPYLLMRDEFGVFFEDAQFAALFPVRGQPAAAPWRLALVTILQFAEGLSDRQAAEAVRRCIDWKYLLSLELADEGFDASVLAEFRTRLIEGAAEHLLFETLLSHFRERKLLKARGKQRSDSTHVLAAIRTLNRLELVGETMRHALNSLAVEAPEWLLAVSPPEWVQRYGRSFEDYRLPKQPAERAALAETIGADGAQLMCALYSEEALADLRELPAMQALRSIWIQQYYHEGEHLRLRTAEELPPRPLYLSSPYDLDARYGKKRGTSWIGAKMHVTETCDPDSPRLITDVQTSASLTADSAVLPEIHAHLEARGLLPQTHLVDSGYVEATGLVQSRERYGVDLVGPSLRDTSWQARAGQGFAAGDFSVDWQAQVAHCPQGKQSVGWDLKQQRDEPVIQVRFSQKDCRACPSRSLCTDSGARRLTLRPEKEYRALQALRQRERTEEFVKLTAARAGVEGTHSQAVRRCGVRHNRYTGQTKTHLQHLLTATALNFLRTAAWLGGTQLARTRRSAWTRIATPAT